MESNMDLKEYIVTLNNMYDSEAFYNDMETPGGDNCIPDRPVDVAIRRPMSRNTHYFLTDEEAEVLATDSRVLAVELTLEARGIEPRPCVIQNSKSWDKRTFNKSSTRTVPDTPWSQHKNWALLRCTENTPRANWGDGSPTRGENTSTQSALIDFNGVSGRNVDVIIVDGHIDPNHPEFARNPDGSGGSRVVQYNWFQHNPSIVGASTATTYVYTPNYRLANLKNSNLANSNDNHGEHVAGTVAGNTQGWAKNANIYNLHPYSTNPNGNIGSLLFDYIRAFHATKPINTKTGRKNPTICNCSWSYGTGAFFSSSDILSIVSKGVSYPGPFTGTSQSLFNRTFGIQGSWIDDGTNKYWLLSFPFKVTALDADIADAINDGIVVVVAAGNENRKIDVLGGEDYDNRLLFNPNTGFGSLYSATFGGSTIYYHRGSTPGGTQGVISAGAVSNFANNRIAAFSNHGPGITVFAPGQAIMSSVGSPFGFRDGSPAQFTTSTNISSVIDYGFSSGLISNTLTKTTSTGWTGGGQARNRLDPGGGLCFTSNQTNKLLAAGLTTSTTTDYTSLNLLNYGFYIKNTGKYDFIESGNVIASDTDYTTSTLFQIEYNSKEIVYKTNATTVRKVSAPPTTGSNSYYGAVRINSPISTLTVFSEYTAIVDPRNSNYYLDKIAGTSMAAPQVAGVLACILENYPTYTQTDCISYLSGISKTGQITDYVSTTYNSAYSLRGAPNRYLYFTNEKALYRNIENGIATTNTRDGSRKESGIVFPRSRIKRK